MIPVDRDTLRSLSDPFLLAMLGSLGDALTEQGYDMLFSRIGTDQLLSAAAPYDLGRAIGVILVGQWGHHDQINELAARGVPIVVWGAHLPDQRYCCIGTDNVAGGELATAHLISMGRKRIAFFGDLALPEPEQRYRGYCAALSAHHMQIDPQLQVSVTFDPEGGVQAVEEMARRGVHYDAVFASSDLIAMTAIDAMRERGISVPLEVAVVGYDDIEQSAYFQPRLTTVRQPIAEAGQALLASLLSLVDGKQPPSVLLPTELMVRASGGQPLR
ncbi:MAG: substrate-binding domain-containing protein [Pseudomonadota bacterium]